MACKCRICGANDVSNPGDVCELCAIGLDPYSSAMQGGSQPVQNSVRISNVSTPAPNNNYVPSRSRNRKILINGSESLANIDPYGNSMDIQTPSQSQVQVYHAGQTPQTVSNTPVPTPVKNSEPGHKITSSEPLTSGITKNIMVDNPKKSILMKWFRSLFMGIPFSLGNEVTMFQVFPDFSGTSLNSMGNACDQVIIYGKVRAGSVAENNDVEVYGHRDSNNFIVAKEIRNKASGTVIRPEWTMSAVMVWVVTILVVILFGGIISALGTVGVVWAIVIFLCLTNLPLFTKILAVIFGGIVSMFKRLF